MPISNVISALVQFIIQFILFAIILIVYKTNGADFELSIAVFAVPFFVLHMAVLGLGLGLIITSLTTKYRDLTHLVGFAVQLWMYATRPDSGRLQTRIFLNRNAVIHRIRNQRSNNDFSAFCRNFYL